MIILGFFFRPEKGSLVRRLNSNLTMNNRKPQGRVASARLLGQICLGFALCLPLVGGCGTEDPFAEGPEQSPEIKEILQPQLRMVGPSGLSAGDTLTIFGERFVEPALGYTRVVFDGVYQATSGWSRPVHLEVDAEYVNQGVVEWTFGPNIPFAGTAQQETGDFRGTVNVINIGHDGMIKPSPQALPTDIQVLPSIIIREMRPVSHACGAGISATTEGTKFLFKMQTTGLKAGTEIAPLRFVYTFLRSNFRFTGYFRDQLSMNPEALFPEQGPLSVIDDVTDGDLSNLGTGIRNVYVEKQDLTRSGLSNVALGTDRAFGLSGIETAPIPQETADYYDAQVTVLAIDSEGMRAKRTIPLRVWSPVEIKYDGHSEVVRSFDPVPVSGCVPGGPIGTDVAYRQDKSETRQRALTFNASAGLDVNVWVVKASVQFGMGVNESVTSGVLESMNITVKLLPREFGAFYRQTLQLERRGKLVGHDPCGHTQSLGEAIVTDWVWSPDMGKGKTCPPLPASNLPPGQILNPEAATIK